MTDRPLPSRSAGRCAFALLLGLALTARAAEPPPSAWEPVGLSGGGAMYVPAVSPVDPERMMVHCDMSAAYVSHDGGLSWKMVHYSQLRSNTACRPAFHPTDPRTIVSASGWEGLKISRDGGATWQPMKGLPFANAQRVAFDPADPNVLYVTTFGGSVWKGPASE